MLRRPPLASDPATVAAWRSSRRSCPRGHRRPRRPRSRRSPPTPSRRRGGPTAVRHFYVSDERQSTAQAGLRSASRALSSRCRRLGCPRAASPASGRLGSPPRTAARDLGSVARREGALRSRPQGPPPGRSCRGRVPHRPHRDQLRRPSGSRSTCWSFAVLVVGQTALIRRAEDPDALRDSLAPAGRTLAIGGADRDAASTAALYLATA